MQVEGSRGTHCRLVRATTKAASRLCSYIPTVLRGLYQSTSTFRPHLRARAAIVYWTRSLIISCRLCPDSGSTQLTLGSSGNVVVFTTATLDWYNGVPDFRKEDWDRHEAVSDCGPEVLDDKIFGHAGN
jgi:hypothetical protein